MPRAEFRRILPAALCFAAAIAIEVFVVSPMLRRENERLFCWIVGSAVLTAAIVGLGCGLSCRRAYYGIMCALVFGGPYVGFAISRFLFMWEPGGQFG
jgi:hypothetical protein